MQGLDESGERDENILVPSHPEGGQMIQTWDRKEDPHGKQQLGHGVATKKEHWKIARRRATFLHKPRNGAYDTVTYYHVAEGLMRVRNGEVFRTRNFITDILSEIPMSWDAATVGRVINDISESLQDAYGFKIVAANRRFDGTWFDVTPDIQGRVALERLVEDLAKLVEAELAEEEHGKFAKRMASPLLKCPSVSL